MTSWEPNSEVRGKSNAGVRAEPRLEIAAGTFLDEALLQLVEDCVVPTLVERFLRQRVNLPELVTCEHNVDQP